MSVQDTTAEHVRKPRRTKLNATASQFARYGSFLAWFFKDALLRYKWRLVAMILANVAGVGLQTLALVIAYQYARAVETGVPLKYADFALEPRSSLGLLVATSLAAFIVAVASALLVMWSRVEGARIGLDYAEFCNRRAHSLISRLPLRLGDPLNDYILKFAELATRDAAYCGLVLRTAIYGSLPVGTLIVAGAALLILDLYLTLVVFGILLIAATFLRRTSISGASHREDLQHYASQMGKDRRALGDRVGRNAAPVSMADSILVRPFAQGGFAKFKEASLGQRHALESGKLIAQVAVGVCLFVVLLVQGSATLSQGSDWSSLLAYVAALSFFGSSMVKVGRIVVSINQYYPPLARHARVIGSAEREVAAPLVQDASPYKLSCPALGETRGGLLEIRKGCRLALVLPGDATRYAIMAFATALQPMRPDLQDCRIAFPWFVTSNAPLTGGSLREDLGLPSGCSLNDLKVAVASLGFDADLVGLPEDLDRPLTDQEQNRLPPKVIFVLRVISGLLNRRTFLALEQLDLSALEPEVQQRLLEKTSDAVTLISYKVTRSDEPGRYGESAVVICSTDEALGWAPLEVFLRGGEQVRVAITKVAAKSADARSTVFAQDESEELA